MRQFARHFAKWRFILRLAEKLVQALLNLAQSSAQLIDHTSHCLTVADAAVQVFHPSFEGFRLATGHHLLQPLRQPLAARAHLRIRGVHVLVSRLQIQHGGGHLHGNRRQWRLARAHRDFNSTRQGPRQFAVFRVQLEHGFTHRIELVGNDFHPVGVAPGQRRPGFRGAGDALSGLHQDGRIKAPKLRRFIIKRFGLVELVGDAQRCQRGRIGCAGRLRLCAKKQQILSQPFRHQRLTARQCRVLQQDAGSGTFGVHIG